MTVKHEALAALATQTRRFDFENYHQQYACFNNAVHVVFLFMVPVQLRPLEAI